MAIRSNLVQARREWRAAAEAFRRWRTNDFRWENGAPCPRARVEANGAVVNGRLYLIGGYETIGHVHRCCDVYDFREDRWLEAFDIPDRMAETHSGVASDGRRFVYILGGQTGPHCGPCTDRCFVLDVDTRRFAEFPALPAPRYLAVAHVWHGRIHVVGGSLPDRFAPTSEHWSIGVEDGRAVETTWRAEPPIPRGGMHRGSVIVGDALYVVGGVEGDVKPVPGDPGFTCDWNTPLENTHGEVYRLNSPGGRWERLADMVLKLGHTDTTVVADGNRILVFGGTANRVSCTNRVWQYDIASNRWTEIGTLPLYFKSTLAAKVGGRFYLVTGQRATSRENLVPSETLSGVWLAADPRS